MLAAAMLCAAAAIGLGYVHPFGNPAYGASAPESKDKGALLKDVEMPAQAKAVLIAKCADCHSDATRWPPYAKIAPGSWLIERDVIEGRKHMNLSKWAELTPESRETLLSKIVHEAKRGDMPPLQYRALHWDAKLSSEDLQALSMLGKEGGSAETGKGGVGNAERGKTVFNKRCTGCHAIDANRDGPQLRGVFGRKAGAVPGFDYSPALKRSGVIWDEDSLDKWLSDADAMVKGNDMDFRILRATERSDIIAYLKQTK